MSMTRILILVAALGAAGLAAFLVRGLVAGGLLAFPSSHLFTLIAVT